MQDFCFKTTDQGTLTEAMDAIGLVVDGDVVGDWLWIGQVVETPGVYDPATGEEVTPAGYLDGEYAVYRATDAQATVIEAATWPDGISLVEPPAGLPLFGGEWLQPDLATLQAEACARVDARAEDLRNAVVTPGSGQMAAYRRKEEQARAILQDPEPNETKYPAIYNEVGITANTAQEVAEEILAKAAAWWEAGDVIERARLAGKRAVLAATSVAAIQAAEASVNWP